MILPPPTPPPALAPGRNLAACLGLAFVQGCLVGNDPLPPSVRDAGGVYDAWQGDRATPNFPTTAPSTWPRT